MSAAPFAQRLLTWFDAHGRHDLPWQRDRTAYRVWISEIMLQQTQVKTVIPYFERFMTSFPSVTTLANATLDEVLHLWTGLGYYARARNLLKTAQRILAEYQGQFPTMFSDVLALPGIGRSTAGAILALAGGQRHPVLDGNVKRVLTRYHAIGGWPGKKDVENQLWDLVEKLTPQMRVADYTQAIMDLGATVCTRTQPDCDACPLAPSCQGLSQGQPTAYPTSKPRKTLPVRQTTLLMLRDSTGQILLERRPPVGIWGGLWSFPECPTDADIPTWCRNTLGITLKNMQPWDTLRHTFSHFHLDIQPVHAHAKNRGSVAMEPGNRVWYNTRKPDRRGFPAPIKRLLEQLPTSS